jgi:tetratricopeptide (TPR) repeat protein
MLTSITRCSCPAMDTSLAAADEPLEDDSGVFSVDVVTPSGLSLRLHHVSAAESVMSLRQLLSDVPQVAHFTCYDLIVEPNASLARRIARPPPRQAAAQAARLMTSESTHAPQGVVLTDDPSRASSTSDSSPSPIAEDDDPSGRASRAFPRRAREDDDPSGSVPGSVPRMALNDFLDLAEYPDVCAGKSQLRMSPRPYDVRQIRLHLRRLREIMMHPPAPQPSVAVLTSDGQEVPCVDLPGTEAPADSQGSASATSAAAAASSSTATTTAPAMGTTAKSLVSESIDSIIASAATEDERSPEAAMELLQSVARAQGQLRLALEQAPPLPVPVPRHLQSVYSPPAADAVSGPVTLLRIMQPASAGLQAVRSISLSGWNPPPPARAVLGDLLYIDVVLEDSSSSGETESAGVVGEALPPTSTGEVPLVLHVTATASGFFLNCTKGHVFDPEPLPGSSACHSATLVGLLHKSSPAFRSAYESLLARAAEAAAATAASTLAPWETLFNMSVRPPPALRAAAVGEAVGGGGSAPPGFTGTFASIGEGYAFARRPWLVDPTGGRASGATSWVTGGAFEAFDESGDQPQSRVRGRMTSALSTSKNKGKRPTGKGPASKREPWWHSPAVAWRAHRFDLNRAEDELAGSFGMDDRGSLRDWNEEYQSCRALPKTSLQERVVRARALTKVMVDFVEAATRGALAIARGHVPPLNPTDDPSTFVYVFNSIFFSLGMDEMLRRRHRRRRIRFLKRSQRRKLASDVAGVKVAAEAAASGQVPEARAALPRAPGADEALADAASVVPSNHDLHGVRALNRVDITGLHTLLTVVVDVAGRRVVAQSIIPGILQGEHASTLVYGSTDNGATVASEPKMHALMREAADQLGIAERIVDPSRVLPSPMGVEASPSTAAASAHSAWASDKPVPLCGPVECKGIVGSDGRRYVLDMVRSTPRDPVYYQAKRARRGEPAEEAPRTCPSWGDFGDGDSDSETEGVGSSYTALLRPELVEAFHQHRLAAAAETDAPPPPPLKLNVNVYSQFANGTGSPEEVARDEETVCEIADFLQGVTLPQFVEELYGAVKGHQDGAPLDGEQLTDRMHARGINVRYLGQITKQLQLAEAENPTPPALLELCETEMVARVARRCVDSLIRDDPRLRAAPGVAVAAFLNALLGAPSAEPTKAPAPPKKDAGVAITGVGVRERQLAGGLDTLSQAATALEDVALSRENVWNAVRRGVKRHFGYRLTLWQNGGFDEEGELVARRERFAEAERSLEAADAAVKAALEAAATAHLQAQREGATVDRQSTAMEALETARAAADGQRALVAQLRLGVDTEHPRVSRCRRVALLRRLCQKSGVQVVAREYALGWASGTPAREGDAESGEEDARGRKEASVMFPPGLFAGEAGTGRVTAAGWAWSGGRTVLGIAERPFRATDIAGLVPVVKHCLPPGLLPDAAALHEEGRKHLVAGQLQEAYQCVQEALLLLYQVCGAAHAETAACCATLAVILWHAGDKVGAMAQQQRATVLMELLKGVDHYDTTVAHANLAYFLGGCGELQAAAYHMRRSLLLMDIIGGSASSEAVAAWLKLGMIYQDAQHTVMAVACFHEAFSLCRHDPSQAAACLHALAVAHSTGGGFKEALAFERQAQSLLREALGESHPRAVEAGKWCRQFARKAQTLDTALLARVGHEPLEAAPSVPSSVTTAARPKSVASSSKKKVKRTKR